MFWEMYQQGKINSATNAANRAQRSAERIADQNERAIAALEAKIDSLALTCRALFEFLESHNAITEEELKQKMEEIDLRDGTKDGRITPRSKVCNGCGRRASKTRSTCLYCGSHCVEE